MLIAKNKPLCYLHIYIFKCEDSNASENTNAHSFIGNWFIVQILNFNPELYKKHAANTNPFKKTFSLVIKP